MNWQEMISTLGFPIVCVIAMGVFIYRIYQDMKVEKETTREDSKANMEAVQARCKEREDKLYEEIKENRAINGKFADIIAKYDSKLDEIITDVKDIKEDIMDMKAHQ